jgi:ParB/RepB/Spo0J family partition protein
MNVQEIPVEEIQESPQNPRRSFDEAALADLTASVTTKGVLVPLLVRPVDGHYELVAGARRFRAAQRAGLSTVPAIVRFVNDEAALEEAIIENLQREDVPPLDEARGFRGLMDFATGTHTAASIAARIGKSERYVWDRLRLLELIPDAQRLVTDGRLPLAHAELLSKLTPVDQARALDPLQGGTFQHDAAFHFGEDDPADPFASVKPVSVPELRAWIADHIRFNSAHFAAAAPLDFGPVAEMVEATRSQPGRGKKVIAITHDHFIEPDARAEERTYCGASWKRADGQEKSKTCDRSVLGVVVVGPGYGEAFAVCVHKDCDVHWKAERLAREKRETTATPTGKSAHKETPWEASERKRKAQQAKIDEARAAFKAARPAILDAIVAAVKAQKAMALRDLVLFGVARNGSERQEAAKRLGAAKTAEAIVQHSALMLLLDDLDRWDAHERFPKLVKTLGVDVAKILKAQAGETEQKKPAAQKRS